MITNLHIVVISLNLKEDTLATLHSLQRAGAQLEQIIVVDNGSTDGTLEALQEQFGSPLHIIANQENLGLGEACNQGMRLGFQLGAEWVLILNNDIEVAEDFFEAFDHALCDRPDYHIFHPAIFYYTDRDILWHMGAHHVVHPMIWRSTYAGKKLPPGLPEIVPVDAVSSCAIFIHRQVYETIGLFDPAYIIYWDDVEFCWRANQAGFRIAVLPRVRMWHKVSKTMNREKPRARYLNTRNMIHFYHTYAHGLNAWVVFPFALAKSLLTLGRDVLRRQTDLIPPLIQGWKDGWRGRLGRPRL